MPKNENTTKTPEPDVWLVCLSADRGFRRGSVIKRSAKMAASLIKSGIARKANKSDLAIAGIPQNSKKEG